METDTEKPDEVGAKKIEIHVRTRVFLLKRIQKSFLKYKPNINEDLLNNSTFIFTFLFKTTTSIYEEVRDVSFEIFKQFFKVISFY